MTKVTAIIAGGGSATRMNGINKLTYPINKVNGFTILESAVFPFVINENIDSIILTYSSITYDEAKRLQEKYDKITLVQGGYTRTGTIQNALKYASGDIVLIHDGARPYLSNSLINKIIKSTIKNDSAIPYTDSTDSLYNIATGEYVNRSNIKKVQTPQGFRLDLLIKAMQNDTNGATDEGHIFNKYIKPINLVEGEETNIKITTQDDLDKRHFVGVGYDVHKLVKNRKLILGGVEIDHYLGLLGHSDADVLTHAIMDSLLGAAGLRDIGYYFPDTDDKYLGISSITLLEKVRDMLKENGFEIVNINSEIMAEKPKLKAIIPDMIKVLSSALQIDNSKISVSCTTTEKLGIIGNEQGIATYSVCSLQKI